jgi:CRISPR-associated endonuclease/helicase Cas3
VSLADWIASNPAPGYFPYDGHSSQPRLIWARQQAKRVVLAMTLDTSALRADLVSRNPDFETIFGGVFSPNEMQVDAGLKLQGPITCIEAPTGSGKTEAALWHFLELFKQGAVDGLYFALPMRTAARQIHSRLRQFIANAFPDPAIRPNVVLALPGYARENLSEGTHVPRHEVLWRDKEVGENNDLSYLRWAAEHPKRFLAATISAGTIDQALLAVLQTRHAHLRGAALARHLIVVDEVHASDAYQNALMRTLLDRHIRLGGRALLLSATLTQETRAALLSPDRKTGSTQPEALAHYPLLSYRDNDHPVAFSGAPKSTRMIPKGCIDDPDAIAALAIAGAKAGARVLIVRNSVAGVLAVQLALEQRRATTPELLFSAMNCVTPHHGRYSGADRETLDAAVELRFGKGSMGGKGCILVGSQTLEISIDCDADFLITDLCPADVLLQRLGRLHRHARTDRPLGYQEATAIVLTPTERDLSPYATRKGKNQHGLGIVYSNILMLDLTWQALIDRPIWTTPTDNRALVENCIGAQALKTAIQSRGPDWERNYNENIGVNSTHRQAASRHALDWSKPWIDQDWAGDLGEDVATRLGLRTLRLELASPATSVFGNSIKIFDIPGWVRFPENQPDKEITIQHTTDSDGTICFVYRGRAFRYGRFGLEV